LDELLPYHVTAITGPKAWLNEVTDRCPVAIGMAKVSELNLIYAGDNRLLTGDNSVRYFVKNQPHNIIITGRQHSIELGEVHLAKRSYHSFITEL
jgi:hypothetical protein